MEAGCSNLSPDGSTAASPQGGLKDKHGYLMNSASWLPPEVSTRFAQVLLLN